ncbi:MAG: alcohol dehydrogenase catalytic domain-containing protein [Pseudomonadota bacterium]
MMRAARLHEVGQPFQLDEVEQPQPTGSDVLVRVRACGVVPNLKNVVTHYPEWFPFLPLPKLPAIYGLDPAGEVAAVGPDVKGVAIGQRVYVNPLRYCGTCLKCRDGKPMACEHLAFAGYFGFVEGAQEMFDRYPWGGLAEYMIAPARSLVSLPDGVSFEQAARFGYLGTAYGALRRAKVGPDTCVLVNGATGTIGVGAILLCLAMGVPKILAVARNEEILARLQALAADRIFTHSNHNGACTDWAMKMTGGYGVDVVVEALGPGAPAQATMDAFMTTAACGTIVTVGGMDEKLPFDPIWLMCKNISYLGSAWFTTHEGHDMANMAGSGALDLSPLENLCFPLDRVNEALDVARHRSEGGLQNIVVMP